MAGSSRLTMTPFVAAAPRRGGAVLIEFNPNALPLQLHARLFDLRRRRLRPVVAHPERYAPFWRDHPTGAITSTLTSVATATVR